MLQNKFYIGIMEIKGKSYPHSYDKIVDEYTFNKCQKILHSKAQKNKKEVTKADYTFMGLLRNKVTNRLMSGSSVKGNTYYRSPKYADSPASSNIKESIVLEQVADVFKQIQIPAEELEKLREKLQVSHEAKNKYRNQAIQRLQDRHKNVVPKLDRLLDAHINGSITQSEYDKKATELKQENYSEYYSE
jgi:DNA repair ATPase RecN